MPQTWVVKDTVTELFLTSYSTDIGNCQWGNVGHAVTFLTQASANAAIGSWGDTEGRYVGQNPPPH